MTNTSIGEGLRRLNPFRILRESIVPRMARAIPHRAEWFVAATFLFSLPFLFHSYPLAMARDLIAAYDVPGDPESRFYKEFKKTFPTEFFLIAFERDDLFTTENLTVIKDLTTRLEGLEDVRRVVSLSNARFTEGRGGDLLVDEILSEIPQTAEKLAAVRRRAFRHPLVRKNLLSKDGRTTAIGVFPRDNPTDINFRFRLMEEAEGLLAPYRARGYEFHVGGTTAINVSLAKSNEKDMARFTGLMYLFLTGMMFFLFRNPRLVGLALLNIVLVVTSVRGFAGLLGLAMNNFSVVSLPLGMALALSDTVHLYTHLDDRCLEGGVSRREALARALRKILFPCFLTSLNTGIGFFSLTLNRVQGLHEFAVLASAAMVFEFLYTFFLTTPLLLLFPPEKIYRPSRVSAQGPLGGVLRRVDTLVHAHPRLIVLTAAMTAVAATALARGLTVNTNVYTYFHRQDPVRSTLDFIENRLAGVESIEISLTAHPGAFKDPAHLRILERIVDEAVALPGVETALSMNDFLAMVNRSFHNEDEAHFRPPDNRRQVEQMLLLYGQDDIGDFVSPDYSQARIVLLSRVHNTTEQSPLVGRLQAVLDRLAPAGLRARLTGQTVVDLRTADAVVTDMTLGIVTSILTISLVMWLVLESLPLTGLFLLPNLLPILVNFGLMRCLGMSLSAGNALIAAAAFGMIVDDTVHFFTTYIALRRAGVSLRESVRRLIASKGGASFSSFLILFTTFGVLMTSAFKPTFQFGFLNIVVLLTGIAADQLLMNALLLWVGGTPTKKPDPSSDEGNPVFPGEPCEAGGRL